MRCAVDLEGEARRMWGGCGCDVTVLCGGELRETSGCGGTENACCFDEGAAGELSVDDESC